MSKIFDKPFMKPLLFSLARLSLHVDLALLVLLLIDACDERFARWHGVFAGVCGTGFAPA